MIRSIKRDEKAFLLRGTPYRILIRGATVVLEFDGKELPAVHPDVAIDIAQAILRGSHPAELTSAKLMTDTRVAVDWADQRLRFGYL